MANSQLNSVGRKFANKGISAEKCSIKKSGDLELLFFINRESLNARLSVSAIISRKCDKLAIGGKNVKQQNQNQIEGL